MQWIWQVWPIAEYLSSFQKVQNSEDDTFNLYGCMVVVWRNGLKHPYFKYFFSTFATPMKSPPIVYTYPCSYDVQYMHAD